MKINIITISLSILLLISCGGGTDNGNVPTCEQLDSSDGERIAKKYLIGSWIVERNDPMWGMERFKYDGNELHMWWKEADGNNWRDEGLLSLRDVKKYKQTTTYGCTEYVFNFKSRRQGLSIIVESMRGACIERTDGRVQFVHYN